MIRLAIAGAAAVLAAATLSACSVQDSAGPAIELPTKNINQWRMPLDQYLPPSWDPTTYATQLLTKECMDGTQYDWPLPALTVDPPRGESWNAVGRKLFTPELARKYGYGNSPEHIVPESERAAFDAFSAAANGLDDAGAAAFDRCWAKAAKRVGAQTDPTEFAQSLQDVGQPSAADTETLTAAERRWQRCMEPAGIAGLPASPEDMDPTVFLPPSEQSARVDTADGAPVPAREREVALLDATCQESSGWVRAAYSSEWNVQAEQVRAHADELERFLIRTKTQHDHAMQIIAEHSPEQ